MLAQVNLEASGRRLVHQHVFETAVHRTRMAMALSDPNLPDCPLVYVNPAFTELTGYALEAAIGRNCRFLQGPETDRDVVRRIRQAVADRIPINEEVYNYRRDGSGFWNALYISPVFDDEGKLTYFFASQLDISARKEAARRQMQRMESIGALASGVAHEFNNLMTVVLGSLERATARATDESQRRHLERADWGAQRAGQLAGELLALARREANEDRTVDLNEVLRAFEGTLAQVAAPRVQVSLDLAPTPARVSLDPGQVELVLLNLIRNAVDAMPAGGQVRVATRVLSAFEATSALQGREAIELVVEDMGEGMSPEVLERATELFFTTKGTGKGTGLGLFLALEFVDKSGGRLMIDSQAGEGTKVRLLFPHATEG
ncbi:MAG: PAS domain-containing protein [Pseudomonadota bacterium]|nr:PAS domain-containing protein [Pseudomonadota bacterium]